MRTDGYNATGEKEEIMGEYKADDLTKLPPIDPKTGANKEAGVVSAAEAKRLSDLAANPGGVQETAEQRTAREAQEEADRIAAGAGGAQETEAQRTAREAQETADRIAAGGEDKTITVGGVAKKRSEWMQEFQEKRGLDLSAVPENLKDSLLADYIAHEHQQAWQRNLTQKSEALAVQRKEVEAEKAKLQAKSQSLSEKKANLEAEKKRVQAAAALPIEKKDIYGEDDRIDPDKQFDYQKKKAALERLPELDQELAQIQQEVVHTNSDRLLAEIEIVQTIHPQLETSVPIAEVAEAIEKRGARDHPDAQKYYDIQMIADHAERFGLPMEVAADRLIKTGQLVSVRETNNPDNQQPARNTAQEDLVAGISRKQKEATTGLPAGGAPGRVILQPKPNIAQEMRKASSVAAGGGNSSELGKLGY